MINYSIVITSANRSKILAETLSSIERQSLQPQRVIFLVNTEEDYADIPSKPNLMLKIFNSSNSAKRNYGAKLTPESSEIILFLDDDVELDNDYAKFLCNFLSANPHVVAVTGKVLADQWMARHDARRILDNNPIVPTSFRSSGKHWVLHGCNMAIRRAIFLEEQFDENLPLYSWGEDYELSIRLARRGAVGRLSNINCIHLRAPSGRLNRKQLAWSIMANKYYFLKKGSIHNSIFVSYIQFIYSYFHIGREQLLLDLKSLNSGFPGTRGLFLSLLDLMQGKLHPSRLIDIK